MDSTASESEKMKPEDVPGSTNPRLLSLDDFSKLTKDFPKDTVISILRAAADRHKDVFDALHEVSDADTYRRTLVIHGLRVRTTIEQLIGVYSKYGELDQINSVVHSEVVKDGEENMAFGVITYRHTESTWSAMKEPLAVIDGRSVAAKFLLAETKECRPPIHQRSGLLFRFGSFGKDSNYAKSRQLRRKGRLREYGLRIIANMQEGESIADVYRRPAFVDAFERPSYTRTTFIVDAESFMWNAKTLDPHYWTRFLVEREIK